MTAFDLDALPWETVDGVPRVQDKVLGAALGYAYGRRLRDLVQARAGDLEQLDPLVRRDRVYKSGKQHAHTRANAEYWLTRKQVAYLAARCRTPGRLVRVAQMIAGASP